MVDDAGEEPLGPGDVVPGAELEADATVGADRLESHRFVQRDARVVWHGHAGDGDVVAATRQAGQQLVVQRTPTARASTAELEVHAHLARPAIRGTRVKWTAVGYA